MTRQSRRRFLGAAFALATIAGCLGGDGDDTADDQGVEHTVTVGHDGGFVFEPDSLEIDAGQTVEFVFDDGGHNIIVTEQPDGADWEGVEVIQEEGDRHEHTFDVDGRYAFVCGPHEGQGMEGEILVGEADTAPADDEDDDRPSPGY